MDPVTLIGTAPRAGAAWGNSDAVSSAADGDAGVLAAQSLTRLADAAGTRTGNARPLRGKAQVGEDSESGTPGDG